jgi:hypothetical protein
MNKDEILTGIKKLDETVAIEEIMDTFDFNKVLGVMLMLDWKYRGGTPAISDLKYFARVCLENAISGGRSNNSDHYSSTGGFRADYTLINNKENLGLSFIVTMTTSVAF